MFLTNVFSLQFGKIEWFTKISLNGQIYFVLNEKQNITESVQQKMETRLWIWRGPKLQP